MANMQYIDSSNLYGIDVSHLNGVINWSQVATDPKKVAFAFIKASENVSFQDANFATNAKNARLAGIPIGAYHYIHPGTTVGFGSRNYNSTRAITEAANFLQVMKNGLGAFGDYGDLHLVIDLELPSSPSTGKSGHTVAYETLLRLGYVNTFRQQMEGFTGKRCVLYTLIDGSGGITIWNNFNYPTSANQMLDAPLWVASYTRFIGAGNPPAQAGGWQEWLVWQWSDSGVVTGIAGNVDQDWGPSKIDDLKDLPSVARGLTPIKNLYVLNPNMKLQVVLSNDGNNACPFYNAVHKEQINQENSLIFSIPANHPDANYVTAGNLVFYRDFDDPRAIQLFEILRVEENHEGPLFKDVICQHKVFELIDSWIENLTLSNVTAAKALRDILNYNLDVGATWWVGAISPTTPTRTFNFKRITVMDAIRQVVLSFGTEWQFRVKFIGSDVRVRFIDFLKRGSHVPFGSTSPDYSGRTFQYGKDLTNIKRTVDSSRIVTKAFGIGNTTNITFSTVAWSTASGNPVTHVAVSPPRSCGVGMWIEDVTATCTWGRYVSTAHTPKATPRVAEYQSKTTSPQNLIKETWNFIQANKNPWVAYEMSVADLEFITGSNDQKIRLGNTVRVVDTLFEPILRTSARIYEMDRNLTQPEKTRVVVSNILPVIGAS